MQIKNSGITENGFYWIKRSNGNPVYAYCIMNIDGGGWTRLDSSITSITNNSATTSWNNHILNVTFQDINGCSGTTNHRITGQIPYTEMMIFHTRVSGIGQCQGFSGAIQAGYYDGSFTSKDNVIGISMCTWGSGPHTDGSTVLGPNQKRNYFFRITGSDSFSTTYSTACSGGSGTATEEIWVRVS
jgi:hypothetical protein